MVVAGFRARRTEAELDAEYACSLKRRGGR